MRIVKTKRANVVTFTRPSVKAIMASSYEKPGAQAQCPSLNKRLVRVKTS